MSQLVDYSFARPSPAAIKRAGYLGVMRYISSGSSKKNLTISEKNNLLAAGLGIGLVWEDSASKAGQGYGVGRSDGFSANAHANALGYPAKCPIFYAVDYDTSAAKVTPYFQGVVSAGGRPVGIYGSANVVDGVNVPYKWQTVAWSHGRVSSHIHLYQRVGGAVISGTDVNDLKASFPLWGTTIIDNPIDNGGGGIPVVDPLNPLDPLQPIQEDEMSAQGEADIKATLSNIEGILTREGNNGIRGDVQQARDWVGTVADEARANRVDILAAIAAKAAVDVDVAALSATIAPLLVAALSEHVTLTESQVEDAIWNVLNSLKRPVV